MSPSAPDAPRGTHDPSDSPSPAPTSDPPLKILFVGNSYTYYNNLVHILTELRLHQNVTTSLDPITTSSGTASSGCSSVDSTGSGSKRYFAPKLRTLVLTEGGRSLGDGSHASDFALLLPAFDPDVVVLQDHSVAPTGCYASSHDGEDSKAATKQRLQDEYLPAVREWALGTTTTTTTTTPRKRSLLFFCTHARPESMFSTAQSRAQHGLGSPAAPAALRIRDELDMLKRLETGYDEYCEIFSAQNLPNFQASVVPVGRTVVAVRDALSSGASSGDLPHADSLFVWDEPAHPSPCGTLVAAMALFRGIMNTTNRLVDADGVSLRADASCLVGLSTGALGDKAVGVDKAAFLRVVMEKVEEVGRGGKNLVVGEAKM